MSETAKRIISGITIGALVALALYFHDALYSLPVFLFVAGFSYLGIEEFYRLADRGLEGKPIRSVGFLFALLLLLNFYFEFWHMSGTGPAFTESWADFFRPWNGIVSLVMVIAMVAATSYSLFFRPIDGSIYGVSVTYFAVIYACLPLCVLFRLFTLEAGLYYFLLIALATIMTDVGAYFAGKWFGKHNAGLKVSPKKTYEGYAGGLIFAALFNVGFQYAWIQIQGDAFALNLAELVILTLVLSVLSVLGDLSESAMKRDAKIKDSASMIPGHGGVLDLIDALLFTIPLGTFYFYFVHG